MSTAVERVRVRPLSDGGGVIGYVVSGVDTIEAARRAALLHPAADEALEYAADPRHKRARTGTFAYRFEGDGWGHACRALAEVPADAPGSFVACCLTYPSW